MNRILLLILSITAIQAACRTKTCKQKYGTNYEFYNSATYGGDIHPNPTAILANNREYRDYVNSRGSCTGQWCNQNAFSCGSRGTTSCYHVEHIIDQNGNDPRIPTKCKKCKNIPGNMIMASGQWNSAVGGLAGSNYGASLDEKTTIYGSSIINRAYQNIDACCQSMGSQLLLIDIPSDDNSTYDESCDTTEECNCDSGATCGCDCDYDDATMLMYSSAIFSLASLHVTALNTVLISIVFSVVICMSVCLCYICHKMRQKKIDGEQIPLSNI